MNGEYTITHVENPDPTWGIVGNAISDYNQAQAGEDHAQRLCFALFAPDQEIAGGLVGVIYWDWFCIDLLWVKKDLRGQGYGHRLLTLAEEEARKRGAKHAHLDTFSFQAPKFYKDHGYQVFGELQDFPVGHQRYYLMKQL
jgi:GNAT superfamily N-acetyltransferase